MLVRNGDVVAHLGDSITMYGCQPGGWCRLVDAGLREQGVNIQPVGAGVSGNNVAQMWARYAAEVEPYAPQWLTVLAGTNDAYGSQHLDVGPYTEVLGAMVARAEAKRCRVLLMTMPLVETPQDPLKNIDGRPYIDAMRAVAAANPTVVLADVYAATLRANGQLTMDGTHPNDAGHKLIAETVLAAWGIGEA